MAKIKVHIKNNHASPDTFPPTPEGEAVFTVTIAAELGIPSSVDFSHTARTEGVEDLVVGKRASEHRSRRK